MDDYRVIDKSGLRALGIKFSTQHLSRLEKRGLFPKRVSLTASGRMSRVGWYAQEVQAWLASRPRAEEKQEQGT